MILFAVAVLRFLYSGDIKIYILPVDYKSEEEGIDSEGRYNNYYLYFSGEEIDRYECDEKLYKKLIIGSKCILAYVGTKLVKVYPCSEYELDESLKCWLVYPQTADDQRTTMDNYEDSAEQLLECKYLSAKALLEEGQYQEACTAFLTMRGYKDVDNLLSSDDNLKTAAWRTIGGIVTFGSYEQDNNTENGKEAIEWKVLEVRNNQALLLAKCGLDAKPYNTKPARVTWETCSLRSWLNSDFLNAAFTAQEQAAILTTDVDNGVSQGCGEYDTCGGNNTRDRVFLLSWAESKNYESFADGECVPTAYAIAQGAYTTERFIMEGGFHRGIVCNWWLRSPGGNSFHAANVGRGSSLFGDRVGTADVCVRPALWVNLEMVP